MVPVQLPIGSDKSFAASWFDCDEGADLHAGRRRGKAKVGKFQELAERRRRRTKRWWSWLLKAKTN